IPSSPPVITRDADVDAMLSWTQGRLVFDHAPLSQIAHEIRRWYGVSVTVNDPRLATLPVNLTLDATYPLDVVANIIRVTTGSHVTVQDDSITISISGPTS